MRDAGTLHFVYTCTLASVLCMCVSFNRLDCRLLCLSLLVQMSNTPYIGFTDGACRSTRNLSSTAWVIYDPHGALIDLQGVCLGRTTNNVAKDCAVIELLTKAINLGIRALAVNLDSQLVVLQLNRNYSVRDHHIIRLYLRVRLLERNFEFITHQHIPRKLNTLFDALANHVLDRHLRNL